MHVAQSIKHKSKYLLFAAIASEDQPLAFSPASLQQAPYALSRSAPHQLAQTAVTVMER